LKALDDLPVGPVSQCNFPESAHVLRNYFSIVCEWGGEYSDEVSIFDLAYEILAGHKDMITGLLFTILVSDSYQWRENRALRTIEKARAFAVTHIRKISFVYYKEPTYPDLYFMAQP
jgi:hypothetical protein